MKEREKEGTWVARVSDCCPVLRTFWPVRGVPHLAGMTCVRCFPGQWLGVACGKRGRGTALWRIWSTAAGAAGDSGGPFLGLPLCLRKVCSLEGETGIKQIIAETMHYSQLWLEPRKRSPGDHETVSQRA